MSTLTKIRINEQLIDLELLLDNLDLSDDDKEILTSKIFEIYNTAQQIGDKK